MNVSGVHQLFEAQARRTPDAVAVVAESGPAATVELTYGDLDRLAGNLAHRLRGLGVGQESLVGVCLDRGAELVVALLAVLKAGGAYVPLDPDYPAGRLAYMLADSGASIVITSRELAGTVDGYAGELVYAGDEHPEAADDFASPVHQDNPAYVMYTSGSTGRPKGVVMTHGGVVNRIRWGQRLCQLDTRDRWLQKTPYSFDVSIPEIFSSLAAGAVVVLARSGGHRDPAYLVRVITERRITVINFVPSMLRAFLAEPFTALPSLRLMMCAGEALTPDLVSAVHARLDCDLYNLYGPTETIDVTGTRCVPGEPVTIGAAFANVGTHVLDADLRMVPALGEGQLCLSGVQVARGYHNRPRLTAEQFVPNPHATHPGDRLYLTGDLVRRLPDGALDYLGRMDHQVKVRGHRVELGEIEATLCADPAVSAAAVTVHKGEPGTTRLVAYLVPADGGGLDGGAVRARLSLLLPEYMIPNVWCTLAELPLTASGKTNRAALPEPGASRPTVAQAYVAPRTPTEERLAAMWVSVLGVSPVGVQDGLLDLGGQSLAAARICARVRQEFGCQLYVDDLLTAATVERLAGLVDAARRVPRDHEKAVADGRLSFAQEAVWLGDRLAPDTGHFNIFEAHRVVGRLDETLLRQAFADTIARHPMLRATFRESGGVPRVAVAEQVKTPFTSLHMADERDALAAIERESRRPFSLADGPPVRMTVCHAGPDRHLVLVVIHHIVADEWSMEVLWRDVTSHYLARATGAPGGLPPLRAEYAELAARQRDACRGAEYARHLDYWRGQLDGAPPVLELPADHPRLDRPAAGMVEFSMPAATALAVSTVARSAGATSFVTLLAAYTATLALLTGQDDIVVGTFSGDRASAAAEDVVGLFVNTLALRMCCAGDPTFAELVGRARAVALGAYRHQEVPFDRLIAELRPPRDLSRHPIVQVGFQSLGPRQDALPLPGLTSTLARAGQAGTSLDLLAIVREQRDRFDGELHYRTDLFCEQTARAIAAGFVAVVTAGAGQPERRLSTMDVSGLVRR